MSCRKQTKLGTLLWQRSIWVELRHEIKSIVARKVLLFSNCEDPSHHIITDGQSVKSTSPYGIITNDSPSDITLASHTTFNYAHSDLFKHE